MAKVCANCSTTQGPFQQVWSIYHIPICKNTKRNPDRVTECVVRRDKVDYDKYKELMSSYDD